MRKDTLTGFRLFGVIEIDKAAVTRGLRRIAQAAKGRIRKAKPFRHRPPWWRAILCRIFNHPFDESGPMTRRLHRIPGRPVLWRCSRCGQTFFYVTADRQETVRA